MIRILIIPCLLMIHPFPKIAKAESPLSINIFLRPKYDVSGERLHDLLGKHDIKANLQKKELSEMKEMVLKGLLSKRDFLLLSFSDLLTEPLLAKRIQAIAPADSMYVHIVTLYKHHIKKIIHLKEKRVSLGPKDWPTEMHAEDAFKAVGFRCNNHLSCENNGFGIQANKLLNGKIQAFFITDIIGTLTVRKIGSQGNLELGAIHVSTVKKMDKLGRVAYYPAEIDLSVYDKKKAKMIPTAATPLMLNTTVKASASAVRRVGRVLMFSPLLGDEVLNVIIRSVRSRVVFHSEIIPWVKPIIKN